MATTHDEEQLSKAPLSSELDTLSISLHDKDHADRQTCPEDKDGDDTKPKDPEAVLAMAREVLDEGRNSLREAKSAATIRTIEETLASAQDFERRWESYKSRLDQILRDSLVAMAGAFGLSQQQRPTISEEMKQSVFDGEMPSLGNLCKHMVQRKFKRVVVLAGAGISVAAGIPDYRSPGSGIYELVKGRFPNLPSAESLFHIDYFKEDPRPYYTLTKERFLGNLNPTKAHQFIHLLAVKKLLLRCYTQNVDGLEQKAGVPSGFVIEAHGSIRTAACLKCGKDADMHNFRTTVLAGDVPHCPMPECNGVIKPGIVFYGESLSREFHHMAPSDMSACDLLIIMGTSLKVAPFSMLLNQVPETTPRLLLNMEMINGFLCDSAENYRDVAVLGDVQESVQRLAQDFGWEEDFLKLCQGTPAVIIAEGSLQPGVETSPFPKTDLKSTTPTKPAAAKPSKKQTNTVTPTVAGSGLLKASPSGKAQSSARKQGNLKSSPSRAATASHRPIVKSSPSKGKETTRRTCSTEQHLSKRA